MPDKKEDPNFDSRAQSRFDALVNDGGDWTWTGLANALSNRYGLDDLGELHAALGSILLEAAR